MRRVTRWVLGSALISALLLTGCAAGSGQAKGPATGRPTMYEFSTES